MNPDEPENKSEDPIPPQQPESPDAQEPEHSAEPPREEPPPFLRAPHEVEAEASPAEPEQSVATTPVEPEPEIVAEPEPPPPEPPVIASPPPYLRAPEPSQVEEPQPDFEPEPEPRYARAPEPPAPEPYREPRRAYDEPVGEPDIPMPPPRRPGDKRRARDARRNLDLDLNRIKRRKRFGFLTTTISVLFIAFVLVPVTWVGAYSFTNAPSTILMMQRAAEGATIRHTPVPINRISPHVIRAVIAAEDANFCTHDGFDVEAIQDALESNSRGRGPTRGASTISQQVAKNLFLWPERSWVRKGFETYFTALIEFTWSKRRIMEHYLNVAEWGDGNFGIEAAARARFGVSAADLTPLQAARLAAVLPNPNEWRADSPGPYVRRRSATLVSRARVVRNEGTAGCVLNLDRQQQ